jgi:dihydrofolate reductase
VPRVRADISVSLDGFVAGPDDRLFESLDRLHGWLFDLAGWREPHGLEGGEEGQDSDVMREATENVGAVLMGRNMFDLAEEPWGDEPPFHVPVFVVTHRARDPIEKKGGTTFTFVTDGIESALKQAKAASGDGDVSVAGGASVIQQLIETEQLDEIQIHLIPVLLGDGVRLFENTGERELELTRVIDSPGVTHMKFRLPG